MKIISILAAKPGKRKELERLLRCVAKMGRSEPGNFHYNVWQDPADPNVFLLDELYLDDEAKAAHQCSAHAASLMSRIADVSAFTTMVVQAVDVT
ncbi:putative quinol monooxygenase [Dyella telluris]|uniref:Antibiotic biosynthesis monooxygenase n=1 Tax=Dyella telluris TaxID=2763498 RepID=A0A7G8Q3K4_9GAMM|nr:antibiotic biosynthesis monooxygenase family protein [Dyella telluris]QNK01362.1 antibiotic biosynthesis monooxygenase [Dyella telluris]